MNPLAWLEKSVPGFDLLSEQEKEAITNFSLLWSLYEGTILNTEGNANAIIRAVTSLKNRGKLRLEPFGAAIEYFVQRYYDGTSLTYAFHELHLRSNDHRELVERVVRHQSLDDAEILSAVLIVVFRLRNNFFHGVKWVYGIKGQLDNFRYANHRNASNIKAVVGARTA
jgi:hypothetical protein